MPHPGGFEHPFLHYLREWALQFVGDRTGEVLETFTGIAVCLAWRPGESELPIAAEEPPVGKAGGVGEDGACGQRLQSRVAGDIGIDPVRPQRFIEIQFAGIDEPQCGFRSHGLGDGSDVEPRGRVGRHAWRCIAVVQRPSELSIHKDAEAGSDDAVLVEDILQLLFDCRGRRSQAASGLYWGGATR